MSAQKLLPAHTSSQKSLQQGDEKQSKQQFPPRKRSIPLGFDFDLDEVWSARAPFGRHKQDAKNQPNDDGNGEDKSPGSKSVGEGEDTSDILKKIHQLTVGLDTLSSTTTSTTTPSTTKVDKS